MDSRYFYRDIAPLASFEEATNGALHAPLPEDWWVVVTDVMGSTQAIEAGRYKDVNTVGAATIMAVINVDRQTEIPFVFGGDGATLAIPPHMLERTKAALLGAKQMARDGFKLNLRVSVISVREIYARDLWLGVCKYSQSSKLTQTSLSGFGWGWAESVLKDSERGKDYLIPENDGITPNADFTGFECRWKPITARNGFKLAMIVQSTAKNGRDHIHLYNEIMRQIQTIYGDVEKYHPLSENVLGLTVNPFRLLGEAIVRAPRGGWVSYLSGVFWLIFVSVIGSLAFKYNLRLMGVRWGNYRKEVVENADFRKFDGTLKMVVDGSREQENRLRDFLEAKFRDGLCVYGLHSSPQAIMTCLVFTAGQDHAHFVDGSDGGYAVAAKMLKRQLTELKLRATA